MIAAFTFAFSASSFWGGCYINCLEPDRLAGNAAAGAAVLSVVWALLALLWSFDRVSLRRSHVLASVGLAVPLLAVTIPAMYRFGLL